MKRTTRIGVVALVLGASLFWSGSSWAEVAEAAGGGPTVAVPSGPVLAPAPPFTSVGGHVGVATPYLSLGNTTEVIGKDKFLTILMPIGITVHLGKAWALDFEMIIATSALRKETTGLIIDPGVIYNLGPVALGLRVAYQIGQAPNIGTIPLVHKGFKIGNFEWFIEAAFPLFVKSSDVSFAGVAHTGISF